MTRKIGRLRLWATSGVAVALALLGITAFARVLGAVEPSIGIEWVQSSSGPVVISVETGSSASQAGIEVGDQLVTIDGQPVRSALAASEVPWDLAAGEITTLGVVRHGKLVTVRVSSSFRPRFDSYGYLTLVGFAFLVSGTLVAIRWPTVRGGIAYSALASVIYARLVFTHTGVADPLDWTLYWLDVLAGALSAGLLLQLSLIVTRRMRTAWILVPVYLPTALILLVAAWLHPALLGGSYRFVEPVLGIELIDRLINLVFGLAVLGSVLLLSRSYARSRSVLHRGQLRWMQWGLLVGFTPFVILHGLPWAVGASDAPSWVQFLSVLPMIVVPAAFTAALARYRLHDLDLLLRRGLTEVSSVFLTFAVYAAVVYLLRHGLGDIFELSNSATRYVGILLAAVSYPQIRLWMTTAVDRAFYRKRYSYRVTLQEWSRELGEELDLKSLLARLHERVRETLAVPQATVFVHTASGRFEDVLGPLPYPQLEVGSDVLEKLEGSAYASVDPGQVAGMPWRGYLFGMRFKGRVSAVMAVAERIAPDEPLSSEDRSLLATLSAHAATAIEAARLLHEVRQQAEEVRHLHAREQKILESSAVGLLMLDERDRIVAWNRALEEIYALPRDAAIDRSLREVFPLHLVRHLEREIEFAPGREEARVFRYTLTNREGQRRVLNLAISPASGADGNVGARVVTFDDVTERVKLEEQLLQQERLASLGLLAAGVAHEVNTPLTGISSYAQMLVDAFPRDDRRRGILEKIEDQTRRASDIANSLLNLAHPERAVFESLSVNDIIRDTLRLFESQLRRRAVDLEVDLDDGLPNIRGHRGKLQQVLLNLLINARDAVGGEGAIRVRTRAENGRVVLEVADDGAGIDREDLPRIFDPFFTTKGRGRGTGLGLSISYGIVREHEGDIFVESEPGKFTRFRIEIPAATAARAFA